MPFLFPSQDCLQNSFHPRVPFNQRPSTAAQLTSVSKRSSQPARSELYTAWSVIDDAKNKANALSAEAVKELDKASAAAQAKTGGIELYSAQYYAACTVGGMLACVSNVKGSLCLSGLSGQTPRCSLTCVNRGLAPNSSLN